MRIEKSFKFYAGHRNESLEGKCSNLHGHRYGVTVVIEPKRTRAGITMLFADIDKIVESVLCQYDHSLLVSSADTILESLQRVTNSDGEAMKMVVFDEETSAENLAKRLYFEIKSAGLNELVELRIAETDSSVVIFDQTDYESEFDESV